MIIDQHKDFEINSANLKLIRALISFKFAELISKSLC